MNEINYLPEKWSIHEDYRKDYLLWRHGSGNTVEIYDICVGTKRGKGKGRWMVLRLLKELDKLSMPTNTIWAITRPTNEIAKQFYSSLGFSISGTLTRFYRDDDPEKPVDAIVFGLDVRPSVRKELIERLTDESRKRGICH